jgi:hypothetical protein
MKLKPANIRSVNGYDVIKTDGTFTVNEIDERGGLLQVGPRFDTFAEAAECALLLRDPLQDTDF